MKGKEEKNAGGSKYKVLVYVFFNHYKKNHQMEEGRYRYDYCIAVTKISRNRTK
jgi:hypothetical protein